MTHLLIAATVAVVIYLCYGVLFYGTRNSLSQLGVDWNKWLFTLFIWAVTLLTVPSMFDATPENIQPLVFAIACGLMLVGGASITDKHEEVCHNIGAWLSCGCSIVWLAFVNPVALFVPLFGVISGGTDKWQWGGEIGIITATLISLF